MRYLVYKITNLINNRIYIGIHRTKDINDDYMGSGKILNLAKEKYGLDKFKKEILYDFDTEEEMLLMEEKIVNEEFLLRPDTYNLIKGGIGGWPYNKVIIKDKDDNKFMVSIDDPRYLSGEFVSLVKNTLNVKDKNGNIFRIYIDDPRYLSGELIPIWCNRSHSDETKKKISKSVSKSISGKNHPQYGKCWIYNLELKKSKSIPKDELENWIKDGWVKGRKLNF